MTKRTKADEFKAKRQADYADPHQFFGLVLGVDPNAVCEARDGRVVIIFSDDSTYILGNNG